MKTPIYWMAIAGVLLFSLPALARQQTGHRDPAPEIDQRKFKKDNALEQALAKPPAADPGKSMIENGLEQALVWSNEATELNGPATAEVVDMSKKRVELPIEDLLVPGPAAIVDKNPAVQPGLVKWHADFETACAASGNSGKPVFLFHLLGQLDQRFT